MASFEGAIHQLLQQISKSNAFASLILEDSAFKITLE
jgi:hypothetical protein